MHYKKIIEARTKTFNTVISYFAENEHLCAKRDGPYYLIKVYNEKSTSANIYFDKDEDKHRVINFPKTSSYDFSSEYTIYDPIGYFIRSVYDESFEEKSVTELILTVPEVKELLFKQLHEFDNKKFEFFQDLQNVHDSIVHRSYAMLKINNTVPNYGVKLYENFFKFAEKYKIDTTGLLSVSNEFKSYYFRKHILHADQYVTIHKTDQRNTVNKSKIKTGLFDLQNWQPQYSSRYQIIPNEVPDPIGVVANESVITSNNVQPSETVITSSNVQPNETDDSPTPYLDSYIQRSRHYTETLRRLYNYESTLEPPTSSILDL